MTAGHPGAGDAGAGDAARRAARLLRWYPEPWRDRYGAEFTELLISDISDRPRSSARTLDVARGGIVARLARAGLAPVPFRAGGRDPAAPGQHVTASLAALGCSLAVFLAFGAAMWSQLVIGWQWSAAPGGAAPGGAPVLSRPAAFATVVTSVTMLALLAIALLAVLPIVVTVAARFAKRRHDRLAVPAIAALTAATALFIGGRHFGNGWPGTGGQHGGLVPGGLAAFEWATSLSVSAYWAHPAALAAFPAPELAWMALSPFALTAAVASAVAATRGAGLTPRVLVFETRLAVAACAVMAVFLAGCCCWVATGGQQSPFHAGRIDLAGVGMLALALATAVQAARAASFRLRLARN